METVVSVIIMAMLAAVVVNAVYRLTGLLPGCTERVFVVFFHGRGGSYKKGSFGRCEFTTRNTFSFGKLDAIENEMKRREGGEVIVTGYHLLRERNVFLFRAVLALLACLRLIADGLRLLHESLIPAERWIVRALTRTADDAVREYEAELAAKRQAREDAGRKRYKALLRDFLRAGADPGCLARLEAMTDQAIRDLYPLGRAASGVN